MRVPPCFPHPITNHVAHSHPICIPPSSPTPFCGRFTPVWAVLRVPGAHGTRLHRDTQGGWGGRGARQSWGFCGGCWRMLYCYGTPHCFRAIYHGIGWWPGSQLGEYLLEWGGRGGERGACCKWGPARGCWWGGRGGCPKPRGPHWGRRGAAWRTSRQWWDLQHGTYGVRGWRCNPNCARCDLCGWNNPWYRRPTPCGDRQCVCTREGG